MKEEGRGYGHKKLIVWGNVEELTDIICMRILSMVPKTKFKLKDQMERAVSSIGANIIEGYYSGSTAEFIRVLRYSRRSLAELEFWTGFCHKNKFIPDALSKSSSDLLIRTAFLLDRLIIALTRKLSSS